MRNISERPVCHRAEDLVTYLYGEASDVESRDFADHLQQCDACRVEFGVFQQVHDSILVWRNEALGSTFSPAAVSEGAVDSAQFARPQRKLSAFEAVREFFSVSPLWLRTATACAALLLCVLGVLAISRTWNRSVQVANQTGESKFSQEQFDLAVRKQVDKELAELNHPETPRQVVERPRPDKSKENQIQVAVNRVPSPKTRRPRGLSRQEREQLAADLRLIPRDDDELPFVFSDEPNQ